MKKFSLNMLSGTEWGRVSMALSLPVFLLAGCVAAVNDANEDSPGLSSHVSRRRSNTKMDFKDGPLVA